MQTFRTVRNSAVAVLALAMAMTSCGSGKTAAGSLALNSGPAPWPNPDHVSQRVAAAGLPHTASEVTIVHYHAHLDIYVDGRSAPVASSIGRDDDKFFSPLHTHATSGLIHIEAAKDLRFTIGMLFTEWGVRLTNDCVGSYCRPSTPITAYVDGQPSTDALPNIQLTKGREIALVIGSAPASVPSRWDCRANINPVVENPAQCADFSQ